MMRRGGTWQGVLLGAALLCSGGAIAGSHGTAKHDGASKSVGKPQVVLLFEAQGEDEAVRSRLSAQVQRSMRQKRVSAEPVDVSVAAPGATPGRAPGPIVASASGGVASASSGACPVSRRGGAVAPEAAGIGPDVRSGGCVAPEASRTAASVSTSSCHGEGCFGWRLRVARSSSTRCAGVGERSAGNSRSRSNRPSNALNTLAQRPQRTQPSDTLSWSCTTRNTVWQTGQRVARLMRKSCHAASGVQAPCAARLELARRAGANDQAASWHHDPAGPAIRIQPSSSSATSRRSHGA